MKIGFVVNRVATETPVYSTTRLSLAAFKRDHEAYTMGVGDFFQDAAGRLRARARRAPNKKFTSHDKYLEALQHAEAELIYADELDVMMLRNDPAEEMIERPWASTSGIVWGELAVARGVLVVNHPQSLGQAINKMYFQHFPAEVRPKTLITRHTDDVRAFYAENERKIVLKPLAGSGGASVFLVGPDDEANLNQMVEAITRDGYVVAQEYLTAASEGDVRLFVMNGMPLEVKGKFAAFRRVNKSGDMRSNMHVGGQSEAVEVTPEMRRIAEIVRPKLVADGMYLVGLDIVGDKLMEINVFSPGGLGSAAKFGGVDFSSKIIEDLERKVFYKDHCGGEISNQVLASL